METIHIFHTNDIHSHLQYWPSMVRFLKEQRRVLAERGETSFLLDIGDFIDRSDLYTEATLGKGNVELLNEAQYDCVTIGNNEGITLNHEELLNLYNEANFEVVVSNFSCIQKPDPSWLKPFTILTTAQGTKIGVIGATARYEAFYKDLGWDVGDGRTAIIQLAHELRKDVDILVCLSHLGITEDELLAEECALIDVIFGAHTHHVFEKGKYVNNVLLTGGGKFGQYIGHLTLQFDADKKFVSKKQSELLECALFPTSQKDLQFLQQLKGKGYELLNEPLYQLHKTYTKEWFHYSPLADLFAQKILAITNADMALFNAGIFMDDLKKGYVTAADLHNILPHPINLCVIEIKGNELKEIYIQAQNEEWPNLQLKGLGFRGVVVGKMLTYGFTMNKHRELFVNDEPVDPYKIYKLVTLDMFTFGFFFPSFKSLRKKYVLPEFLRDILKYSEE